MMTQPIRTFKNLTSETAGGRTPGMPSVLPTRTSAASSGEARFARAVSS